MTRLDTFVPIGYRPRRSLGSLGSLSLEDQVRWLPACDVHQSRRISVKQGKNRLRTKPPQARLCAWLMGTRNTDGMVAPTAESWRQNLSHIELHLGCETKERSQKCRKEEAGYTLS